MQASRGEECDDGDREDGNGCDADCLPTRVVQIAVGVTGPCALLRHGGVRCWGHALSGRHGYPHTGDIGLEQTPADMGDIDVGGQATQIVTGYSHTCALLTGGTVRCWGLWEHLGGPAPGENYGDNEHPSAAPLVDVGAPALRLHAGFVHTCAELAGGRLRCWGSNNYGILGLGQTDSKFSVGLSPTELGDVPVGEPVVEYDAGAGTHACVILQEGALRCWGSNNRGQLGYGHTEDLGDNELPEEIGNVPVGEPVLQVSVSSGRTCTLLTGGAIRCWGYPQYGLPELTGHEIIGDDEPASAAPRIEFDPPAIRVSTSSLYTCALLEDSTVRCWGNSLWGSLGYGDDESRGDDEPITDSPPVSLGWPAVDVHAARPTCALSAAGTIRCWGEGAKGQLGLGPGFPTVVGDDEVPLDMPEVPVF